MYQIVLFYPNRESNIEVKTCFKSQRSFENFISRYQNAGGIRQFNYDLLRESKNDEGLPFMNSDDRSWHWLLNKFDHFVGKSLPTPSLNKPIKGWKI